MGEYEKGIQALKNDQYEKAIEYFETINQERLGIFQKGIALYRIGKTHSALQQFEKFSKYYPNHIEGFYGKGLVYCHWQKDQDALKQINQAINLDSENWIPYSLKGYILMRQSKFSNAVQEYEKAISKNIQNDPISYLGRAEALFKIKKTHMARKDVQYARRAMKQPENIKNYSQIEKKIILEGLQHYDDTMKSKESQEENITKEGQIIKVINMSFYAHQMEILKKGIKKIENTQYQIQTSPVICQCSDCRIF